MPSLRQRARHAWLGGGANAAVAYLTDYHAVPRRLRPGMEAYLSRRALCGVYAALAAGFALVARRRRVNERRARVLGANRRSGSSARQRARAGEMQAQQPAEVTGTRSA
ncbi:MAG: hypothetical protein ACREUX_09975 [Burkholderiales bacterium]